jgi:hypothetical protein
MLASVRPQEELFWMEMDILFNRVHEKMKVFAKKSDSHVRP